MLSLHLLEQLRRGLPNLSYVARKPKPLGTEFKNVTDGMSGVMMWLEIQERKERMRALDHTRALGGTAACMLRGVHFTYTYTSLIAGLVQSNPLQTWGKLATTVALWSRPHIQEAQSCG